MDKYGAGMKIVQINTTYGYGDSTGTTTKQMHNWLLKNGMDSYVFAWGANGDVTCEKNVVIFSCFFHRKLHALCSRLTGLQGYFSKQKTKQLVEVMKTIDPDVVVLRVLHSNIINLDKLFEYLAKANISVVLDLHDCWYYTGHCCYYIGYPCEKYLYGCQKCEHIREWNKSLFIDTAKRCLEDKRRWYDSVNKLAVVGVSNWVTKDAQQSILKKARIIKRIYNWIDLDIFFPRQNIKEIRNRLGIDNQKVLIAVATSWRRNTQKGVKEIEIIAEKMKDICLVLVGDNIGEFKRFSNVICVGKVNDPNKLAEYYSVADVYVNPSKMDTFGKTTAEALACGTPVVAFFDCLGARELVNENRGALVKEIDVDAFIENTKRVLAKGKEKYLKACIDFARDNFSIDKNMREYINVFESIH